MLYKIDNMNSYDKSTKGIFLSFFVMSIAGIANTSTSMFPLVQSVNAMGLDVLGIECVGLVNYCDDNVDNSVTDNRVDNSDNSQDNDVTISDSYDPQYTNNCANTSGSQTHVIFAFYCI